MKRLLSQFNRASAAILLFISLRSIKHASRLFNKPTPEPPKIHLKFATRGSTTSRAGCWMYVSRRPSRVSTARSLRARRSRLRASPRDPWRRGHFSSQAIRSRGSAMATKSLISRWATFALFKMNGHNARRFSPLPGQRVFIDAGDSALGEQQTNPLLAHVPNSCQL